MIEHKLVNAVYLIMYNIPEDETRYKLIKLIEKNPGISQRDMADEIGVSLGKVNYCLKALVNVGWVKVANFKRSEKKLNYIYLLTPNGIKAKARLAVCFLDRKLRQYETLKREIDQLIIDINK